MLLRELIMVPGKSSVESHVVPKVASTVTNPRDISLPHDLQAVLIQPNLPIPRLFGAFCST